MCWFITINLWLMRFPIFFSGFLFLVHFVSFVENNILLDCFQFIGILLSFSFNDFHIFLIIAQPKLFLYKMLHLWNKCYWKYILNIYVIQNNMLPTHMLTLLSHHLPFIDARVKLSEITFRYCLLCWNSYPHRCQVAVYFFNVW